MGSGPREVWITGAGLVSSLGEGLDAQIAAVAEGRVPVLDRESFSPGVIHPLVPLDLDKQIAKKLDQRQMEPWQRIGTYAAGLALQNAGLRGDAERLAATQMIVAAGGGERDAAVDASVLEGLRGANDSGAYINQRLMSDLRPTLFLAQLSNLLAGNIAIVHGVIGASRTFMGEEGAGIEALRVAHARIAAGQGDTFLVGGALSAARWDLPLLYELGGHLRHGAWAPVFERGEGDSGFHLGSVGAFLVAEEAEHARARGAAGLARLTAVSSDRSRRRPGDAGRTLARLWDGIAARLKPGRFAILSCATGSAGPTAEERDTLAALAPDAPVRAIGNLIGHGMEAQFPAAVLLAIPVLRHGLFPPAAGAPSEKPHSGPIDQVVVTGIGHWRGEGIALVERAE